MSDSDHNLKHLVDFVKSDDCKNIVYLTGAGLSVAASIPDFRSPGSGLYSQLAKYDLPFPEAIFTLDYLKTEPRPFFKVCREMLFSPKEMTLEEVKQDIENEVEFNGMGNFGYTPVKGHFLPKFLDDKNKLCRYYTQNIDGLESDAGLSADKLIQVHGHLRTSSCIGCNKKFNSNEVLSTMLFGNEDSNNNDDEDGKYIPKCDECGDIIKPDCVLFGEGLPSVFFKNIEKDLENCDLLIVMGTSLQVQPVASMIHQVNDNCKRLIVNREIPESASDFEFTNDPNCRDFKYLGDIEDFVDDFVEMCDWKDEFDALLLSNPKYNQVSNL
eukprot:TRINITY_DN1719_c0_g1_i1.p1 TRINITY_DN1719_c0_g1~~TRINITY_DN1719_c0_g1_i1.p1  ORF type:complete len:327 (-),score=102.03 TRINITY_DN1719_c0_g1_i1:125-1105(-)